MLHPRFTRLVSFPTGEVAAAGRSRTAAHVSSCPGCRETVTWMRDARAALRTADGPGVPAGAWERIQACLEAGDVVLLPGADVRTRDARRRGVPGRRIAIAASLVLAAGAAAAVAPWPSVREWIERTIVAATGSEPAAPQSHDAGAAGEERRTTLIVPAANGGVTVDIDGAGPGLEVRIRTGDIPELEVEASGGAAVARFQSGSGRLSITDAGAGVIVLRLPDALDRATIGVDGTPYVTKRGDELRVLAPFADTVDSEIVLRPGTSRTR